MMYAEDVVRLAELQTYFLCVISQETTGRPAPPTLPPPQEGVSPKEREGDGSRKILKPVIKVGLVSGGLGLREKPTYF